MEPGSQSLWHRRKGSELGFDPALQLWKGCAPLGCHLGVGSSLAAVVPSVRGDSAAVRAMECVLGSPVSLATLLACGERSKM